MHRCRLVVLPFAVLFELLLMALAWVLTLFSLDRASGICQWARVHLPSLDWYISEVGRQPWSPTD